MSTVDRLDPVLAARLRAAPFTYPEVGATLDDVLPSGYRTFTHSARVGTRDDLDRLGEQVLGWQVQLGAGLRVAAPGPRIEPDGVAMLRLGPGPLGLRIPVRVVRVLDEPGRRGFVYGTLPGHPEIGEESFVVERRAGGVHLVVRAFGRPGTLLARLGGPGTRLFQDLMTRRYLSSLT